MPLSALSDSAGAAAASEPSHGGAKSDDSGAACGAAM
jgi:hypothetical protein